MNHSLILTSQLNLSVRHMHTYVADVAASEGDYTRASRHYGLGSLARRALKAQIFQAASEDSSDDSTLTARNQEVLDASHAMDEPYVLNGSLPQGLLLQLQRGFEPGNAFWKSNHRRTSYSYQLSKQPRNAIEALISSFRV